MKKGNSKMLFYNFYFTEGISLLKKILSRVGNKKLGYDEVEITDDYGKFLLPDGRYLQFDNDHRFVLGMADMEDEQMNRTQQMWKLMKIAKMIRFIPESGAFQIVSRITYDQKKSLLRYLRSNGFIEIEFGENRRSTRYDEEEYYDLEEKLSSLVE